LVQTCALLREKSLLSALLLALVQALDLVLTGEKLPALILAGKHVPTLNLTLTLTLVLTRENVPALVLILTLILVLILALTQILTREDVSTLAEASLLASLLLLAAKGLSSTGRSGSWSKRSSKVQLIRGCATGHWARPTT